VPGAPAASGGAPATCRRPQEHSASCRSCWIVCARASGRSVTWCEYFTPRSRAPARSFPHSQVPCGKCGTVSSGSSRQARNAPGAPGCLPCLRPPPRRGLRSGGFFPGRSSVLGGIEELPLLRETSRSSRATRSSSSAFRAFRSAITASLSSSSIRCRSATSRSREFSACSAPESLGTPGISGAPGTPVLHQSRPSVSNRARRADQRSFRDIFTRASTRNTVTKPWRAEC